MKAELLSTGLAIISTILRLEMKSIAHKYCSTNNLAVYVSEVGSTFALVRQLSKAAYCTSAGCLELGDNFSGYVSIAIQANKVAGKYYNMTTSVTCSLNKFVWCFSL